jgi:microcystin degradation protein MlrC
MELVIYPAQLSLEATKRRAVVNKATVFRPTFEPFANGVLVNELDSGS